MRHVGRLILLIGTLFLAGLLTFPLGLRLEPVQTNVRNAIRSWAIDKSQVGVDYSTLQLSWLPLSISVNDLKAFDLNGAFTIKTGRASFSPALRLLLQQEVSPKIDLYHPEIFLDITKLSSVNDTNSDTIADASTDNLETVLAGISDLLGEKLNHLGPPAVIITSGQVMAKLSSTNQLAIENIDLVLQENGSHIVTTRLLSRNISAVFDGQSFGIAEINLRSIISGYPQPENIEITTLDILGQHQEEFHLNGQVDLNKLWPIAYSGNGSVAIPLTSLKYYIPDIPPFYGQIDLNFKANSKWSNIVQGELKISDLAVVHRPFGDIFGKVNWDGKTALNVKDLRLTNMVAELLVNADITLIPAENFPITFTADIDSFSLAPLLEIVPIDFVPIILEASGKANFTGTLWPFKITGEADLYDDIIDVYGDHFRDKIAELGFYTPPLKVKGGLTITKDDIEFHHIPVTHPQGGILLTSGGLSWKDFVFYMHIDGRQIDLAHLAHLVDLPWTGQGNMVVELKEALSDPRVIGHLDMQKVGVMGLQADQGKLTVIYKDFVVSLPEIHGQLGHGSFSGRFLTDMHGDDFLMDTKVHLKQLPLELLLPQLAANDIFSLPFQLHGPISGDFALQGTFDRYLTGYAHLLSTDPTIVNYKLSELRLRSEFLGSGIDLDMWLRHGNDVLFASANYEYEAEKGSLDLSAYDFDLSQFKSQGADVGGTVSLFGNWSLNKNSGSGEVKIKGSNLMAFGRDLGSVNIRLPFIEQTFYLEGEAPKVGLAINGQLAMDDSQHPWRGELSFLDVDYANLLQLQELRGHISGIAKVNGRLSEPQKLFGQMDIQSFSGGYQQIDLHLAEPIAIIFKGSQIDLPSLTITGDEVYTTAQGQLGFNGSISLDINGEIQAAILPLLVPTIKQADGAIIVKANAGGTIKDPYFIGNAFIKQGMLAFDILGEPITNIDANLSLIRTGVVIDEMQGRLGGGKVAMTGQLAFARNEATGSHDFIPHFGLDINNVTISPLGGLSTTLSGQLNFGPSKEFKNELSGFLRLAGLEYTKDFTLEALIPSFSKRPIAISSLETENEWLAFNVKLSTPNNNILIKNNLIDGLFTADLNLTGTNARMGLLGYISPMSATLKYGKNTFTVSHASLSFADRYSFAPHLQLQADTVACSDNVSMSIDWDTNSSEQAIVFSGRTSEGRVVPNEEVMFCLAFGLKSSAYDEYGSMDTSSTSAYLPGSLELLTAMTGLDEKAKQIIPLPIDNLRLTSGYSKRTARTAPWVSVDFKPTQQLRMGLSSSLDEVSDQKLEIEYSLTERSKLGLSWQSASDVPVGDFGLDLQLKLEYK